MSMTVAIDQVSGPMRRLKIGGRLDTHTYQALDQQLDSILTDASVQTLIFDLELLEYISSAGIRSVFHARKVLGARGGRVLLVNAKAQIQKVLDVVKAVPVSDIFRSTDELDAYLDRIQLQAIRDNAAAPN